MKHKYKSWQEKKNYQAAYFSSWTLTLDMAGAGGAREEVWFGNAAGNIMPGLHFHEYLYSYSNQEREGGGRRRKGNPGQRFISSD
jgi:hypothetical protein